MKKFAILVGLMGLALVIGVAGTSFHQGNKAEANADDIVAFNPDVCAAITHLGATASPVASPCDQLNDPRALAEVADFLDGSVDDPATYKDLVDASAAQLGEDSQADPLAPFAATPAAPIGPNSQTMWVLVFVSNDDPITLTAGQGAWLETGATTPKATYTGCPLLPGTGSTTKDPDCDANATTNTGDGVVVDLLWSGKPVSTSNVLDRGDETITASQSVDTDDQNLDYTVVGVPDNLTLKALKDTIQEDSNAPCVIGGYSTNEFTQENALPDATGMLAAVTDSDDTALTGIVVSWLSADASDVVLANDGGENPLPTKPSGTDLGLTVSVFKDKQSSAPEVVCGGDADPSTKISAAVGIDDFNGHAVINGAVAAASSLIDDNTEIAVVPAPGSLSLAAAPNPIVCDGVNSSTVTATVLGTDSKPVVTGNKVRFDVVALGAASPITAVTDAKGTASTKVTPLSGVTAGVTALVSVMTVECVGGESTRLDCFDAHTFQRDCLNPCKSESTVALDDLESNILVSCQQPAATAAPPPAAAPNIVGPRTGDGGYLP